MSPTMAGRLRALLLLQGCFSGWYIRPQHTTPRLWEVAVRHISPSQCGCGHRMRILALLGSLSLVGYMDARRRIAAGVATRHACASCSTVSLSLLSARVLPVGAQDQPRTIGGAHGCHLKVPVAAAQIGRILLHQYIYLCPSCQVSRRLPRRRGWVRRVCTHSVQGCRRTGFYV